MLCILKFNVKWLMFTFHSFILFKLLKVSDQLHGKLAIPLLLQLFNVRLVLPPVSDIFYAMFMTFSEYVTIYLTDNR